MTTIIIPDIHNRVDWIEDTLSLLQPYDKVIFLGDYFDDFNDTIDDVINSAKWLKESLKKPNRIHLLGTHDIWYRFYYNPYLIVSGNTTEKEIAINHILDENDWNQLTLYHFEQNFLITHAGLHTYLINGYVARNKDVLGQYIDNNTLNLGIIDIIDKIIDPATKEALIDASEGHKNLWLMAGYSRGGLQPVGGLIWLDWNVEFDPIPYINQIVGHSDRDIDGNWREFPSEIITINSKNYCIDTRNRHIGILDNEKFMWLDNKSI